MPTGRFESADATEWAPLLAAATSARAHAYAPYSNYAVGAALACSDGSVVAGCNVENASYGGAICAERSAVVTAVTAGKRTFVACVVVTQSDPPGSPCGFCRQVLKEFAQDMPILLVGAVSGARRLVRLAELLPDAFGPADLAPPRG